MNLDEKFFDSLLAETRYFFDELPKEVSSRVKYHVWLMGTYLGSLLVFMKVIDQFGLATYMPPAKLTLIIISVVSILALISFVFSILSNSLKGSGTPDFEALLNKYSEMKKNHNTVLIEDAFGKYWMDKMVVTINLNHDLHEKKMGRMKLAFKCFLAVVVISSLVPIWLLIKIIVLGG